MSNLSEAAKLLAIAKAAPKPNPDKSKTVTDSSGRKVQLDFKDKHAYSK